jgi:hypothetical protein
MIYLIFKKNRGKQNKQEIHLNYRIDRVQLYNTHKNPPEEQMMGSFLNMNRDDSGVIAYAINT